MTQIAQKRDRYYGPMIIAGSRTFPRERCMTHLRDIFEARPLPSVIVSGCAAGPDSFGIEWAEQRGLHVVRFPADWKKHGKRAGILRNVLMAEYAKERAGELMAFWDGESRGTAHMIEACERIGVPTAILIHRLP